MFVWSLKLSKREIIIFAVGIAAFILLVFLLLTPGGASATSLEDSGYTLTADSADSRARFLSQFGWETESDPTEVREIVIPAQFGDVYNEYNELQKKQGFDLEKLRGERVKKWTYVITNYPNVSGAVVANLLIKDGKVVGGDISSAEFGGFMHGFEPSASAEVTSQAQTSASFIDRSVPASIPSASDTPPEPEDL